MTAVTEVTEETTVSSASSKPITLCQRADLVAGSGVCALLEGRQIALFYLPEASPQVYAIDNWDPIGKAHVLSRGIVGDVAGRLVVASPLYKQHFDLLTGECLEDGEMNVSAYSVVLDGECVMLNKC